MSDAPLPSSFDGDVDFYNENRFQKFARRLKEEPLIPLGIALTCWALYNAQQSMRTGNSIKTNRFFRYRLYAQSFTLFAMVGGSLYYQSDRLKRGEYVKLKEKQKAQEKREKWIKELEVRDQEDKEWRAKLGKVRDLQREEDERLAMEAARTKAIGGSDDGRGAMAELRKERRQKEGKRGKELDKVENKGAFAGPVGEQMAAVQGGEQQDEETKKYQSIMGESERGGLLGLGHLKGLYEDLVKPMFEGEKRKEESVKPEGGDEQNK